MGHNPLASIPEEPDVTASQAVSSSNSEQNGAEPKKNRRARGEQTRLKILEATLRVIAENGVNAVTHRAVAKEADVSLSLTTYYFKDLQELLLDAFAHHKNLLHEEVLTKVSDLEQQAGHFTEEQLQQPEVRQLVVDKVIEQMVAYVEASLLNPQGCQVEMSFFFDLHLPEHFRMFAYSQRKRILSPFVEFFTLMGSATPDIDSDILAGTIQRLQYEALAVPSEFETSRIRADLERVLGALIG